MLATGFWKATRMSSNGKELESGVIPNEYTAMKIYQSSSNSSINTLNSNKAFSRSLGRDQWQSIVLGG